MVFIIAVRFVCFSSELRKELDVIHLNERMKVNICRASHARSCVKHFIYIFSLNPYKNPFKGSSIVSPLYRTGPERCSS